MQSTFRRETRPDRVPLLLSSVSDSECFPFPPARSGFLPAPQTPPAARSVKFPHSKSCPLLSSSAPVSPAGRRSLAHQCASCCLTLGPKDTIRQIVHTPRRPVPRKPTSNPVPCFRSPASTLWFWCHKQTGSLARSDPKEKKCPQNRRGFRIVKFHRRTLPQRKTAEQKKKRRRRPPPAIPLPRRLPFGVGHTREAGGAGKIRPPPPPPHRQRFRYASFSR